jgi:GH24 family phage-related lysozyme (muramidase)
MSVDFNTLDPNISPQLATDLDSSEKNELVAYQDSLGVWTIGRGHVLPKPAPGRSWANFEISQAVSDRYFNGDILIASKYAKVLPEWTSLDTPCRQNALIELCFNMSHRWATFDETRALMKAKNWQGVHDHLLASLWASQVQPHLFVSGVCSRCHLIRSDKSSYCPKIENGRADRIANYFLIGEYPT